MCGYVDMLTSLIITNYLPGPKLTSSRCLSSAPCYAASCNGKGSLAGAFVVVPELLAPPGLVGAADVEPEAATVQKPKK